MRRYHTTADEKASLPPILTFPLMGGRDTLTGTPPPLEGED